MTDDPPTPNPVWSALAAMQRTPLICVKERRNTGLNSAYANLADVWALLRPHLTEHQLCVSFGFGSIHWEGNNQYVALLTTVVHAPTGTEVVTSGHCCIPAGNKGVNEAQREGSAKTYAMRYALCAFFGIVTGDDDDAVRAMEPRQMAAPGAVSPPPRWQDLSEGSWRDCPVPGDKDQTMGGLSQADRKAVCRAYPDHPAVLASISEGIERHIDNLGHSWESACEAVKWSGPKLWDLTANELHDFAALARGLKDVNPPLADLPEQEF